LPFALKPEAKSGLRFRDEPTQARERRGGAMSIKLQLPQVTDLRPRLTVIGVGGAGCNAVNNMIAAGLTGVDFVVANTDAQALSASSAEHRLQLGANLTEGLGAGAKPEIGEAAAEEAVDEIKAQISGSHMVFLAAGMGGGTGTGAASVIARSSRDMGILTVGVVTKPFLFEGSRRMKIAEAGIEQLRGCVDTLIVIPNQNLFRIANERTTFAEAFVLADQVLYSGVACIVDLILKEGLINLDFADVRAIMSNMGTAMMGTGEAEGERRAVLAAEEAIANPLLDDVSLKGAKGLLLSITGGAELTLYEVDEAASRVREEVDADANIIVGATFDDTLGDKVRVSIVASGMLRQGGGVASHARPQSGPTPPCSNLAAAPTPDGPTPGSLLGPDTILDGRRAVPDGSPMPPPVPPGDNHAEALGEGGYEQRLNAAMQVPGDRRGPGEPAQSLGAQGADHHAAGAARETWQAPGDVLIEEGRPELPTPAVDHHGVRSDEALGDQSPMPPSGFKPQPPREMPRSGRRMPDIGDFPQVGQREFHAKAEGQGQPAAGPARNSGEPQRKPSLFQRWTGFGRQQADSDDRPGESDERRLSRTAQHNYDDHNARRGSGHDNFDPNHSGSRQNPELPEFFDRKRR